MSWQAGFQQFLHRKSADQSVALGQQIADSGEMPAYVRLFIRQLVNAFACMGDTAVMTLAEILGDSHLWKPGE